MLPLAGGYLMANDRRAAAVSVLSILASGQNPITLLGSGLTAFW
jgi:hypothetical protein